MLSSEKFERSDKNSPLGLAVITRKALNGESLAPLKAYLIEQLSRDPDNACAWLDLSIVERVSGHRESADNWQRQALLRRRCFSYPCAAANPLRLLALLAPGDFMANTPLEFLLESQSVALETLFIRPGDGVPLQLPDHDVAFVAVAESEANRVILASIEARAPLWPRPLINRPGNIARLTRDGAWRLLHDAPGIAYPVNRRARLSDLLDIANGRAPLCSLLGDGKYPIIVRPVGSHAGDQLERVDENSALAAFLSKQEASDFYLAPFVDYKGEDGLYRKIRMALIDGVPYPVHLAISKNWMVHYLNADMTRNAENRAEEARFMADFDRDFARRHAPALAAIYQRTELDYLVIDCAESPDGGLLVFEVGTAMIVHALDPVSLFPYKQEPMKKLFAAFEKMLRRRVAGETQVMR